MPKYVVVVVKRKECKGAKDKKKSNWTRIREASNAVQSLLARSPENEVARDKCKRRACFAKLKKVKVPVSFAPLA